MVKSVTTNYSLTWFCESFDGSHHIANRLLEYSKTYVHGNVSL